MQLSELWHFPRPALARRYLAMFDTGLVTSTTIFAPRRTGKTRFLIRDLTPVAVKAGYQVVYADLWQTNSAPATALVNALQEALEPRTFTGRVVARLKTPVKSLKASAEVAGSRVQGEVTLEPRQRKPAAEAALLIDGLVTQLVEKAPLLLLIDEAQALARNAAGEDMARALRTTMTTHANRLRVVFTGSSRTRLGHVFSNVNAPLYSAGIGVQEFPLLDEAFVDYVLARFNAATTRTLDRAAARKAFDGFGRRPEPFLQAVVAVTLEPRLTLDKAVKRVADEQARQENHEGTWESLDALERALVRLAAEDAAFKPFARQVIERLRRALGVDTVQVPNVQKALGRLSDRNVVTRTPRGVFEFENERFADWVRNLAD